MINKQLNNLVISYQTTKDELVFSKVYAEVVKRWHREGSFSKLSTRYRLDFADVESLANYELLNVIDSYKDVGDFYNMLSVVISRRCIDRSRKLTSKRNAEISLDASISYEDDNAEGFDNPLLNFLIHANVEDEAIENLQRNSDQRQLIAHLTDEASDKSVQAIKAYVESDFSYTRAAKLLGMKYDTVKRNVEKVASCFDANQNGFIYDYFTVATKATA